jgi:hypothetical protein|tara:strand:- start:5085 stop:5339 length:255 start_codon:yes stop_codon:yes gene_type:complete
MAIHKIIMELIIKYDSPETVYLMARALAITAITKAEKDYYGFLTMQNALNDTAQELIALSMGEEPTEGDEVFEFMYDKDNNKLH